MRGSFAGVHVEGDPCPDVLVPDKMNNRNSPSSYGRNITINDHIGIAGKIHNMSRNADNSWKSENS